jgi:hypothetical protein
MSVEQKLSRVLTPGMTSEDISMAIELFLARGGEIVSIPEVRVVSDGEALNYLERATTGCHGKLSVEERESSAYLDTVTYKVEL